MGNAARLSPALILSKDSGLFGGRAVSTKAGKVGAQLDCFGIGKEANGWAESEGERNKKVGWRADPVGVEAHRKHMAFLWVRWAPWVSRVPYRA